MKHFLFITTILFSTLFVSAQEQTDISSLKPDPVKEQQFLPYLSVRHGGPVAMQKWKESNTALYYKELWYYTESFHIVRNHRQEGIKLDEAGIDISRFESYRKENETYYLLLPGFRDAIVLTAKNKLKFKPDYIQ
jgi:hypothetical protein